MSSDYETWHAEFPWTALTVVAFAVTVPVVGIGSTIWIVRQSVKGYNEMTLHERIAHSMRWEIGIGILCVAYLALPFAFVVIESELGFPLMESIGMLGTSLISLFCYLTKRTLLRKLRNTGPVAALAEVERPAPVPA